MNPRRTTSVGTMFATVVVVAVVAASLDAEGLRVWAERLELGAPRTAALALAERWAAVGETLGSTALRRALVEAAAGWTAEPQAAPDAPVEPPPAAAPSATADAGSDSPAGEPVAAAPVQAPGPTPADAPAPAQPLDAGTPQQLAAATTPVAAPAPASAPPDAGTPPQQLAAAPALVPEHPDAGAPPQQLAAAPAPATPSTPAPPPRVVLPEGEEKLDPKEGEAQGYGPRDGKVVLLVGDSMIGSSLGPELVRELLKRGGYRVVTAWQPATGLSRGDFYDWGPRMAALMARHKPSHVVVTLGTNDGQDIRGPGRKPLFYNTPAWGPGYEQLVRATATRLTRNGAQLLWLDLPPMRPPVFAKAAREVNLRVANALVGMARVRRVPVPSELVGENGAFSERSSTEPPFTARASDGVHWSQKSGRLYALTVADLISSSSPAPAAPPASAARVE